MSGLARATLCAALLGASCAGNGMLEPERRSADVEDAATTWSAATERDVPGVYVSRELTGPLAAHLRKLVYLFEEGGRYAGAALVDAVPPRFEVLAGTWAVVEGRLILDGGPPAVVETSADGALRLSGDEGVVVLERERAR